MYRINTRAIKSNRRSARLAAAAALRDPGTRPPPGRPPSRWLDCAGGDLAIWRAEKTMCLGLKTLYYTRNPRVQWARERLQPIGGRHRRAPTSSCKQALFRKVLHRCSWCASSHYLDHAAGWSKRIKLWGRLCEPSAGGPAGRARGRWQGAGGNGGSTDRDGGGNADGGGGSAATVASGIEGPGSEAPAGRVESCRWAPLAC